MPPAPDVIACPVVAARPLKGRSAGFTPQPKRDTHVAALPRQRIYKTVKPQSVLIEYNIDDSAFPFCQTKTVHPSQMARAALPKGGRLTERDLADGEQDFSSSSHAPSQEKDSQVFKHRSISCSSVSYSDRSLW